jgi:hypothetical protein
MAVQSTWTRNPNHIDFALGTRFGSRFFLESAIDGAIAFANGDVQPDPEEHVLALEELKDPDGAQWYLAAGPGQELIVDRATALKQFSRRIGEHRNYAIETLKTVAAGLGPLTKFLKDLGDIDEAVDLASYPTLRFDKSGRPIVGWRTSGASSPKHWINFAALMAVPARGEMTSVGRCHLAGCGRFFRIERNGPGKPSRKYCPGTNHMEQAHQLGSTARTNRARAAKRDAAKVKKVRRPK